MGGVLVDKFGSLCHLFIALCLDIAAVATVAVPWSPGIEILTVCCAFGGAVETVINIGKCVCQYLTCPCEYSMLCDYKHQS